ncbi:MAG: hypothetical protein F4W90_03675 [Gammaproteobacteria bacterium]|nr:hypothetical protein [Gammaproteobacteria bacterium]
MLSGDCVDQLELANTTEIELRVDLKKFTFRRASTAMLSAGMVRWRDCLLFGICVALSSLLGFVYVTWAAESVEQPGIVWQLPELEPAPQLKYQAAMQLAAIAAELGDYDPALWRSAGVSSVRYDADESTLSLHSEELTASLASRTLAIPVATHVPTVVNSLDDVRNALERLFDLFGIAVAFDEPFALDGSTDAQRVTANLREFPVNRLIELAGLMRELPIELHRLSCSVNDGAISKCELTFAIQGSKA